MKQRQNINFVQDMPCQKYECCFGNLTLAELDTLHATPIIGGYLVDANVLETYFRLGRKMP